MTACQQVAAPWVGTLALMGESVPLGTAAYDEIAEALFPPAGPVSDTSAAPFGENRTANVPGPGSVFTTMGPSVPSNWTWKVSIRLLSFSVTSRN